jgi:hypothetical protein
VPETVPSGELSATELGESVEALVNATLSGGTVAKSSPNGTAGVSLANVTPDPGAMLNV